MERLDVVSKYASLRVSPFLAASTSNVKNRENHLSISPSPSFVFLVERNMSWKNRIE